VLERLLRSVEGLPKQRGNERVETEARKVISEDEEEVEERKRREPKK
jgi:hypothetical protein